MKAEQRGFEDIAKPVTAEEAEQVEDEEPSREERPAPRRRYRLGPGEGQAIWSPRFSYGARAPVDTDVDREVDALVGAIAAQGEMGRRQLRQLAESRYWGPGRFRRALRAALAQGRIRPVGRDRFAASEPRGGRS